MKFPSKLYRIGKGRIFFKGFPEKPHGGAQLSQFDEGFGNGTQNPGFVLGGKSQIQKRFHTFHIGFGIHRRAEMEPGEFFEEGFYLFHKMLEIRPLPFLPYYAYQKNKAFVEALPFDQFFRENKTAVHPIFPIQVFF